MQSRRPRLMWALSGSWRLRECGSRQRMRSGIATWLLYASPSRRPHESKAPTSPLPSHLPTCRAGRPQASGCLGPGARGLVGGTAKTGPLEARARRRRGSDLPPSRPGRPRGLGVPGRLLLPSGTRPLEARGVGAPGLLGMLFPPTAPSPLRVPWDPVVRVGTSSPFRALPLHIAACVGPGPNRRPLTPVFGVSARVLRPCPARTLHMCAPSRQARNLSRGSGGAALALSFRRMTLAFGCVSARNSPGFCFVFYSLLASCCARSPRPIRFCPSIFLALRT